MKKYALALLCVSLILMGCPRPEPEPDGGEVTVKFINAQGQEIQTMDVSVGTPITFSLKLENARMSEIEFSTSDVNVVMLTDNNGNAMAQAEGTATVTATYKKDPTISARITVTVRSFAGMINFGNSFYYRNGGDTASYTIYRLRSYSDRWDAGRTRIDTYLNQDTATVLNHFFPEDGEWFYLYDKEDAKIGLFLDTIQKYTTLVLNYGTVLGNEGVMGSDEGVTMDVDYYLQRAGGYILIQDIRLVDDVLALDKYRKEGVEPRSYPGVAQAGHFHTDAYTEYMDLTYLQGEQPDQSDYLPPFDDLDCYMLYYREDRVRWYYGYPLASNDNPAIELNIIDDESSSMDGYLMPQKWNIDMMVFSDMTALGCATHATEEGLYVNDPIELLWEQHNYSGDITDQYPWRFNAPRPQQAILKSALDAQINVSTTLNATRRVFDHATMRRK